VVILQALVSLARTALRSIPIALLGIAAALVALAGMTEVRVLLLAGLVHAAVARRSKLAVTAVVFAVPMRIAMAAVATATIVALPSLFAYFFKVGSVLFGSGYVLLAVLRGDLVERDRWLTEAQLLDAIAVGQVTPGPVFTSATFIGYLMGGADGAAVATIGIFLPAFFFTAASAAALHRLRHSPTARAFLDGVNAAAVALIAIVVAALGRESLTDATAATLALAAAILIGVFRFNSAWVIAGAAAVGLLL